jgi:VanZ family protein
MKLPSILQRSPVWLVFFLIWFGTLWYLSSGPVQIHHGWKIPHMDKICHFGYFFGGSGLLSAFLYRKQFRHPDWTRILIIVIAVMVGTGALDEWHQSWVPERSGNDALDLTADLCGSLAGFLVFRRLHFLLRSE